MLKGQGRHTEHPSAAFREQWACISCNLSGTIPAPSAVTAREWNGKACCATRGRILCSSQHTAWLVQTLLLMATVPLYSCHSGASTGKEQPDRRP